MVSFITMLSLRFLFLLTTAFPFVFGHPSTVRRVQSPSTDPFYQPPIGFESQAPGTILRHRRVAIAFFGLVPDPVESYQILYRTTSINGSAIATVTTIFKPLFPKTDRFVSFQTAYDSSAAMCNPSYNYQLGAVQTDLISAAEMFILQAYLLSGYIVASPDYEGPDAAFSPGRLEGMGVLDGMRAVGNFKESLGLSTDKPMIVGVGYSGGGLATGWASSLHPAYAAELNIKGWAHGGTPANLTGILTYIDHTIFAGFVLAAMDGLSKPSAYGAELMPLINRIITPTGRSKLEFASSNCAIADILGFLEGSILSTEFQSLGRDLLYDPTLVSVLEQNTMGVDKEETPAAPTYYYHASQDEIVPYANSSKLVESWCNNGASVKFTTFANGGHITTEVLALLGVLDFVKSAFTGTVASGCSSHVELSSNLNPLALGVELEPVLVKLIQVILTAGDRDTNIVNNVQNLGATV